MVRVVVDLFGCVGVIVVCVDVDFFFDVVVDVDVDIDVQLDVGVEVGVGVLVDIGVIVAGIDVGSRVDVYVDVYVHFNGDDVVVGVVLTSLLHFDSDDDLFCDFIDDDVACSVLLLTFMLLSWTQM